MISGQQDMPGAGYREVNGMFWKSGDEPPLSASVVLQMAMLTSVLLLPLTHSAWRLLSLEEGREGRLWCRGLGAVQPALSTGAVQQVARARRDLHPPTSW